MNVFVSSTYIDLIPHREAVWKVLLELGVRVIGMEDFGARSSKPLETCLLEVRESNIFIGIIGMRYGSIDSDTEKSFTQIEYEEARRTHKEIFIYLIDEENSLIHPKFVDVKNYNSLLDFKRELKNNHTVDYFISENDLSIKIGKRVKSIMEMLEKKSQRPVSIECKINRCRIENDKWYIVVGYLIGKPYEIYFIKEKDYFEIPIEIERGEILVRYDDDDTEYPIYDFRFTYPDGSKLTAEGISSLSRCSTGQLSKVIQVLIRNELSIDEIAEVLPGLDISTIVNLNEFEKGIRSALN